MDLGAFDIFIKIKRLFCFYKDFRFALFTRYKHTRGTGYGIRDCRNKTFDLVTKYTLKQIHYNKYRNKSTISRRRIVTRLFKWLVTLSFTYHFLIFSVEKDTEITSYRCRRDKRDVSLIFLLSVRDTPIRDYGRDTIFGLIL